MRIDNQTHWSTRNLKSFVVKVCDQEMVDVNYRKYLTVHFNYSKKTGNGYDDYPGGYAGYNARYMYIHLPKDEIYRPALAKVLAHEMAHNQGVRHKSMHNARYGWGEGWEEIYAWAKNMLLEKKVPVVPTKPTALNVAQTKLVSAQVALKAWSTKKKLAMGKVQRYKDKLVYYQQRIKELS